MYKLLAMFSGMTVAIMILSNGLLVESIGGTPALLFIHITGLMGALLLFYSNKGSWTTLKGIPFFYLLGGVTGVASVYFTNLAFLSIGATVTLMLSLVGRIVTSTIIDHYGLMGMKKYPFVPLKLLGLALISVGALFLIMF